jgi:hypothetical protein
MFRAKMNSIQQKTIEESKEEALDRIEDFSEECENELLDKVIAAFGAELEEVKESNRHELAHQYAKFTSAYE